MIYKTADKGARIGNLIIDVTVILIAYIILSCILMLLFPNIEMEYDFILFITSFSYYFFAEIIFGKTIGKVITKTLIVDKRNKKPVAWRIFVRTLFRFIPLDLLGFLFGTGFHDVFSGTRVVER